MDYEILGQALAFPSLIMLDWLDTNSGITKIISQDAVYAKVS